MATPGAWLSEVEDGVRVALKVTPRAKRTGVQGIEADDAGRAYLAVRVSAPPEDGRANAEVARLLARRWRIAARDVTIVAGAGARRKLVHVCGPAGELRARLRAAEET